ncbi:MAG: sulfotransferase domain-containing protein [Gammaproteobacteria bacterium]
MDLMYPLEGRFEPEYGHNVFAWDGTSFPMSNSAALMRAIDAFACDPRDVTIVGFPKSGTNWVQAMVQKLYDDWGTLRVSEVVPHIDIGSFAGVSGHEYCAAAPHPRLMKSHSHFRHMPSAFREQRVGRVICVTRNPKDVCDSYYNQLDTLRAHQEFTLDWDQWVEHFIAGRVCYGPWLDHAGRWLELGTGDHVLHLRYEDMKRDVRVTLDRIVDFVGRPVGPGRVDAVIEQTGFVRMQQAEGARLYNGPVARREGRVGGWREHFTPAQSEAFDRAIVAPLAARGITFDFG